MAGWTKPDREIAYWDGTLKSDFYEGDGSRLTNLPSGGGATVVFPLEIASGGTAGITAEDARFNLNVAVSGAAGGGGGAVYPLVVASGGTNAATIGDARTNLNVPASAAFTLWTTDRAGYSGADALTLTYGTVYPLIIASGGTGVTTAGDARTALNVQVSAANLYTVFPLEIASGGTGTTTAGDARTNLDVRVSGSYLSTVFPLAVFSGGTGASTSQAARYNLNIAVSGAFSTPVNVASGGTGTTTAAGARFNLDVPVSGALGTHVSSGSIHVASAAIVFVMGASGSMIISGAWVDSLMPYNALANKLTILAPTSGSLNINLENATYANYPTMTRLQNFYMVSAQKSQALSTAVLTAGDIVRVIVSGAATVSQASIILNITKT